MTRRWMKPISRDRFGIKPLFYTVLGETLIFASEIKALLRYPGIKPEVDRIGLWELLFLSPDRIGCIFKGICEIEPAHQAVWKNGSLSVEAYWKLTAGECRDSRSDIIENTRFLLKDAIRRQLVSDVPLCTLLSGGLDSSVISSVAAEYYKEHGMTLDTYSFEYEGNRENFKSVFSSRKAMMNTPSICAYSRHPPSCSDRAHQRGRGASRHGGTCKGFSGTGRH